MDQILKGNYVVPDLEKRVGTPKAETESLTEGFQNAALKKLGGSITFVKKPTKTGTSDSFIWNGE